MSRLFSANMMRLKKSKIFWLEELFMVGYALFVYISAYSNMVSRGAISDWNIYFFNVLLLSGFIVALFVSGFFDAEYSDGVIRNKLMVGHKRRDIYLVNFGTCLLVGLITCATYYLFALLFGCLIIGRESLQIRRLGAGILCSILIFVVYAAIFMFVEMVDRNKARTTAVNLMAALIILVIGMIGYGEVIKVNSPDAVEIQWRIVEFLFPSVLTMNVAAGLEEAPYLSIVIGLVVETVCLIGFGIWEFEGKDIQ